MVKLVKSFNSRLGVGEGNFYIGSFVNFIYKATRGAAFHGYFQRSCRLHSENLPKLTPKECRGYLKTRELLKLQGVGSFAEGRHRDPYESDRAVVRRHGSRCQRPVAER